MIEQSLLQQFFPYSYNGQNLALDLLSLIVEILLGVMNCKVTRNSSLSVKSIAIHVLKVRLSTSL